MFDVGWSELLIIAVVLIVVVGPKDLPPMLRAFGKMTARARKVAGEFRAQFDEALREAELDDVRQTISDAQKLNPVHSLREAMNPLRQMGNDIKADLQRASTPTSTATPAVPMSEPSMGLPETPPLMTEIVSSAPAAEVVPPAPVVAPPPAVVTEEVVKAKVVRKPRAKAPAKTEAAATVSETVAEKPKRAPRKPSVTVPVAADAPAAAPKKRTTAKKKDNA
ncbi:Sec-independent protein translocase protein TatB [Rhizobium sp. BK376]|uniref:Sec-independent protein translocase protein TatB n=1 Tax=Rhizobium sp. BK376 TaxID=2512149 RepID=UPI00104F3077|nr:Sec-independent protein translocase protein TatB [Rhizobium sp. BK376]TCR92637.1 sec-independent protein translocase protein TatB [Rhizobium sp. BK376]